MVDKNRVWYYNGHHNSTPTTTPMNIRFTKDQIKELIEGGFNHPETDATPNSTPTTPENHGTGHNTEQP